MIKLIKNTISLASIFIFVMLIRIYQIIAPVFLIKCCRFTPSCSTYSIMAIKKYGIIKGSAISIKRILSCNPWNKKHGIQNLE